MNIRLSLLLITAGQALFADQQPNFLFIIADDLRYDALGKTSGGKVLTPNLDRLIEQGTYFSHAFNQGGWHDAVSVASRTMLATGQYMWKNQASNPNYNPKRPIWGHMMKEAGYNTSMAGKWHVENNQPKNSFDKAIGLRPGMPNQHPACYARKFIVGKPDAWQPDDPSYGGFWKGGRHWSEVTRDQSIELLKESKGQSKPFFHYIAFNAPHDPRQAPREYLDMYPVEKLEMPANFLEEYPFAAQIGCSNKLRDEQLAPFPRCKNSVLTNRQEYYALISHLDTQIGLILDALEESGQKDNTYIIFTADHGISVGDHGFLGKQNMYDPAVRVPWIIVGPDIPKGKRIEEFIYLQDAMATVLDLAGSDMVKKVDFQSVIPLIKGQKKGRSAIYGAYINHQRMVRTDEYKMILYPDINVVRLYDIQNDPHETKDLAKERTHLPVLRKMFAKMQEEQKRMGDPLDLKPCFTQFLKSVRSGSMASS